MSEMVERVARAMLAARAAHYGEPTAPATDERMDLMRSYARAAIAAMREPTEGMVIIGLHAAAEISRLDDADPVRLAWVAMIDAALKDSREDNSSLA